MFFKKSLEVKNAVLRRTEARIDFLVGIYVSELRVSAIGTVISASAAHHNDRGTNLNAVEIVVIEKVKVGNGKSVEVGKQRCNGVLFNASVGHFEPHRKNVGVILARAHLVGKLILIALGAVCLALVLIGVPL